jgi:hypothetical protein
MTLILLTTIVFTVFLYSIYLDYGILKSVSDAFYKLKNDKMGYKFVIFILTIAISMAFIGNTPLFYIAGGLLSLVAISPAFKDEESKPDEIDRIEVQVHVFGATGGILIGFIALIFDFGQWYMPIPMILFTLYATPKRWKKPFLMGIKNHTWWIEVFAFFNIMVGLLIEKLW